MNKSIYALFKKIVCPIGSRRRAWLFIILDYAKYRGKRSYNYYSSFFKNSESTENELLTKVRRVLVIEDLAPNPALGYGYPRAFHILGTLAELPIKITFLPTLCHSFDTEVTEYFQQLGVEMIFSKNNRNDLYIKEILRKRSGLYDVILISRPHNFKALFSLIKKLNPSCSIIYDAEAVFSFRQITYAQNVLKKPYSQSQINQKIKREIDLITKADYVLAVSEKEKRIFKENGIKNVEVVSHPIEIQKSSKNFYERSGILFIGAIHKPNCPNEDALLYFLTEIYPLITKIEAVPIYIVGVCNSQKLRQFESEKIKFLGRVKDLLAFYESCKVFIAPTRYAAGIPLKLTEAAGNGLPSVVTPLLASQLGWRDKVEVLVGSDAQSFASQCIRLYQDNLLWQNIQKNAFVALERDFSTEKFANNLKNVISHLSGCSQ